MTQTIILSSPDRKRSAVNLIRQAPLGHVAKISPPQRSTEQNSRLWAMLSDISRAKPEGREYPPETWKALFMAAVGHQPRFEPALDGNGVVHTGFRSSRLTVSEMIDLQTCIEAYAAQHGIELKE